MLWFTLFIIFISVFLAILLPCDGIAPIIRSRTCRKFGEISMILDGKPPVETKDSSEAGQVIYKTNSPYSVEYQVMSDGAHIYLRYNSNGRVFMESEAYVNKAFAKQKAQELADHFGVELELYG